MHPYGTARRRLVCALALAVAPLWASPASSAPGAGAATPTPRTAARAADPTPPAHVAEQRARVLARRPGSGLRYDGRIAPGADRPGDGRHAARLTFHAVHGPERFEERIEGVVVRDGRFRLVLSSGEAREGSSYPSLAAFFAAHPEIEMEIELGGVGLAPRVGILPAGHSLASRLAVRGASASADPAGRAHWKGYRQENGATAFEAVTLRPAGAVGREAPAKDRLAPRGPYTLPVVGPMTSAEVRDLPIARKRATVRETEVNPPRHEALYDSDGNRFGTTAPEVDDLLADRRGPVRATPAADLSFDGLGNVMGFLPPDTDAAVGPNHYVQVVNSAFAVYSKNGALLAGPVATNTLWSGFGGPCQTDNSGDAIFLYDQQADRFVLSQFAVANLHQSVCFAVSQTPDPTGAFHLYEVVTPRFPDYYKVGVWPAAGNDAYFFATNSGYANQYDAFALDRARMLAGETARPMQFVQGLDNLLMPADADGPIPPPAGRPGTFYTFRDGGEPYFGSPATDSLDLWEFDVDWDDASSSTFTLAASFTPADGFAEFNWTVCGFFESDCIPQPGTAVGIDSLSWWPMQRLVYRNFGGHETLVGTWTVDVASIGDRAAPRWFELRDASNDWYLYQQGTHSPDPVHRWMPSIAMDGAGNIALGYSRGDGSDFPSIYYATREPSDPLGTLQTEASLIDGSGSQTHSSGRWGDYSSMELDPVDDCTFWYTNEYLSATGIASWKTRVGTFSVPGCATTPPDDLVLDQQTVATTAVFEACGSITLGPDLFIAAGDPAPVFRAPSIRVIGDFGVLAGGGVVLDGTKPWSCP